MRVDMIDFRSWFTVVMFVIFLGIVIWAWSAKRKRAFTEAANLPFADDETVHKASVKEANHE
jgi:cytochrome c oxidase cbb3-type subunit 4